MRHEGLEKKEIIEKLEEKLSRDFSYDSGFILGSMCTKALEFGQEIYSKYVCKNLGDPGLFPGTADLEEELISEIGDLFSGNNITGSFTTGGTEANIIAMRIAKSLRPEIRNPEMVVPVSAHMSFDKGADMLGIKLRKARLKENYTLDTDHFEDLINENTVGAVGIAGTTSLGLIDPIERIGQMIEGKNIFFHVDAAFGGFVLPFLKEMDYQIPPWDFSVEQVQSITADPHKMGLGLIPSGGLFLKEPRILRKTGYEIPYLAGGNFKHLNIVGTRSGGTVIAFWAIMKFLGVKGFNEIIEQCMENTRYLAERIKEIQGIKLVTPPKINVVGITTESGKSICELEENLRKKNWMLGKFLDFNLVRVVVMPHVKEEHLSRFVEDLKKVAKDLNLH